jgi:hypothetical protein
VSCFLLFTLCASVGPGLVQRSAWPFPAWTVFQLFLPAEVYEIRLIGVDASGVESPIDGRAWEPFSAIELAAWAQHHLASLGPADRAEAGRHLVDLANRARVAVRAGQRPWRFDRYLGPLAAPIHIVPRRIWTASSDPPAAPFTGVRVYRYTWNVEDGRQDVSRVGRTLLYGYPEP